VSAPLDTLKIILPYAVTMAAVGSIESLLTLQLLDGIIDDGKRGSTKKEVVG
jgi:SulP family sulfate permease